MNPDRAEFEDWFLTEVEPHRPALRAWLLARFHTLPDLDDVVHEALARVMRARRAGTVRSPRALLFTTARNLALDAVRRQKVIRFESNADDFDSFVLSEEPDVFATVSQQEELQLLSQAIQSLPDRYRQVLTLRTAYGLTQRQIAERLGLSLSSVEKVMAQAIKACALFFTDGKR